jgi:UPF0755 protein
VKAKSLVVCFALACALCAAYYIVSHSIHRPLLRQEYWLVARGTSLHSAMAHVQPDASHFMLKAQRTLLRWQGVDLAIKAGEYELREDMSLYDVLAMLAKGDVMLRQVTLVEGWTIRQARDFLSTVDGLEDDLQGSQWEAFLLSLNLDPNQQGEGWFAPETYHFSLGNSQRDILRQAHRRLRDWLDEAWQKRRDGLPLHNAYQLLILASIVEKETALPSERGMIASVFINRLRRGMRLQTDPTVIYGLGDAFDGDLRRRDIASDSPYNTYKIKGLPPTPIALPSKDALMAVALAPDSPYLYFVAKGDGSSYFSISLDEHQAAVRRYQINRRSDYRSRPVKGSGNDH